MKLHQMPNGDWIDLPSVTSIRTLAPSTPEAWRGEQVPGYRVIVMTRHSECILIEFDTKDEADQLRDEIATLVNQSR